MSWREDSELERGLRADWVPRSPQRSGGNGEGWKWCLTAGKAVRLALKITCFSEHPHAHIFLFPEHMYILVHIYLLTHVRIFTHYHHRDTALSIFINVAESLCPALVGGEAFSFSLESVSKDQTWESLNSRGRWGNSLLLFCCSRRQCFEWRERNQTWFLNIPSC